VSYHLVAVAVAEEEEGAGLVVLTMLKIDCEMIWYCLNFLVL
jgi:hypothetical protein